MQEDGSLVRTHIDIVGVCGQLEVGNDDGVLVGDEYTINVVEGLGNLLALHEYTVSSNLDTILYLGKHTRSAIDIEILSIRGASAQSPLWL